jgi:hypothetical protein
MKAKEQKYIETTLRKQRKASEKARRAFQKSGDSQTVIDFIKASPSGAAISEPWVLEAIQSWMRNDRGDLLKQAFLPRRGERAGAHKRAIENLMFANRIDIRRKAGKTLQAACIEEAERMGYGNLTSSALQKKLTALKNRYQRAKRIRPEITVHDREDSFVIAAFPAKVEIHGYSLFGQWSLTLPKK